MITHVYVPVHIQTYMYIRVYIYICICSYMLPAQFLGFRYTRSCVIDAINSRTSLFLSLSLFFERPLMGIFEVRTGVERPG